MPAYDRFNTRVASSPTGLMLLGVLVAISSIVQIQPAPYDGLVIMFCLGFLAMGMRAPVNLLLPATLLGLFLLANVIAALRIPDPRLDFDYPGLSILALPTRFHLVITWLFFVCVIYEDPVRTFVVIWKGFLIAAILAVGFGLAVQYELIDGGSWGNAVQYPDRVRGTFEDPNVYGPFVVVAAVYVVSTMETATRMGLLLRTVLFLVLSWGVFLSFSRGAWGNLLASLGLFFFVRLISARTLTQQFKVMLLASSLLLGAAGGFGTMLATGKINPLFWERAQLFQSYDLEAGGRFDTQRKALEYALRSPIGAGPGQSRHSVGLEPHNLYLIVPLETGWLGALSLYGFILLTLSRAARFCLRPGPLQRAYTVVFVCTLATALESAIIDTTHWRHLYLLWAMLWGPILACDATRARWPRLWPSNALAPAASHARTVAPSAATFQR
jgi:O-antigen ligase